MSNRDLNSRPTLERMLSTAALPVTKPLLNRHPDIKLTRPPLGPMRKSSGGIATIHSVPSTPVGVSLTDEMSDTTSSVHSFTSDSSSTGTNNNNSPSTLSSSSLFTKRTYEPIFRNIASLNDHFKYVHEKLDSLTTPKATSNLNNDYAYISPDSVTGYTLLKQVDSQISQACLISYHAIDNITREKVILRLSCNILAVNKDDEQDNVAADEEIQNSNVPSVAGFLNEWYLLSRSNQPKYTRVWSHEHTRSEYLLDPDEHSDYDKMSQELSVEGTPLTLPDSLPGVLFPSISSNVQLNYGTSKVLSRSGSVSSRESMSNNALADTLSDGSISDHSKNGESFHSVDFREEKRFMMVYPDNEYVPLRGYDYAVGFGDIETRCSESKESLSLNLNLLQPLLVHNQQQLHPSYSSSSWFSNDDKYLPARSASIPSLDDTTTNTGTNTGTDNISTQSLDRSPPKLSPYVLIEMLNDFLTICQTLKLVHELGIVHNGLTSHNILKSATDPSDIKLTCWDYSFSYQPESTKNGFRIKHLQEFPALVAYMSPETFGKVASSLVDYRSDFYSLGTIMYEMVLGRVPFYDDNPYEVVKLQMLRKPVAPLTLAPNWLPPKLNFIIMKLLEKLPEKRYQSSACLINDLSLVRNQLIDTINLTSITDLTLRDRFRKHPVFANEQLNLPPVVSPNTRFSKNEAFNELHKVYEKCLDDQTCPHVMVLDGEAGTGKSYLISHLKPLTLERNYLYCDWSFGKEHDILVVSTYTSFVSGLRQVISQIMRQSIEVKQRWRDLMIANLPLDGGVLFYMFPDLKELLGAQYYNLYNAQNVETKSKTQQYEGELELGEVSSSEENQWDIANKSSLTNKESQLRSVIKSLYLLFVVHGLAVFLDDFHYCTRDVWNFIYECIDYFEEKAEDFRLCMFITYNNKERPPSSLDVVSISDLLVATEGLKADLHTFHIEALTKVQFAQFLEDSGVLVPEKEMSLMWKSTREKIELSNQLLLKNMYKLTKGNYLHAGNLIRGLVVMKKVRYSPIQYLNSWNSQSNYQFSPKTLSFGGSESSDFRFSSLRTGFFEVEFDEEILSTFQVDGDFDKAIVSVSIPPELKEKYTEVLNFAAIICENSVFSLNDLSIVCGLSIGEVYKILNVLIERRIIMSDSIYYKIPFHCISEDNDFPFDLSDSEIWQLTKYATYKFAFPTLRRYFFSSLESTNQLLKYHRLAGLRFYKTWKHDPYLPILNYFKMAHHFLKSWMIIDSLKEKEMYYRIFLKAGKHAISIYNLQMSLQYYELANKYVAIVDPSNILTVNLGICQNLFYLGQFENALKLIDHVSETYDVEKSLAVITRIRCHFKLGNSNEAITIAVHELKRLGLDVSLDSEECKNIYTKHMKKLILSVNEIRKLKTLRRTRKSAAIMAYEIISEIITPSYVLGKNDLRKSIVIQILGLMHTRGISPYCAIPLLDLANTVAKENTSSGFVQAKEFAQVALSLLKESKRLPYSFIQSVYETYVTTLAVFIDPLPSLTKTLELSMLTPSPFKDAGSYGMGFMMAFSKLDYRFLGGSSAVSFLTNYAKALSMSTNIIGEMINSFLQMFSGAITFEQFSDVYGQLDEKPIDYQLVFYMGTLFYFHDTGKFEQAVTMVMDFFYDMLNLFLNTTLHVHAYFLIGLVLQGSAIENETLYKGDRQRIFEEIYQRFKIWHEVCPLNFKSKYLTLTALRNSREIPTLETLDTFEEAIEASSLTGNWYDSGLANAWCARWLMTEVPKSKRIPQYLKFAITMFETADYNILPKSLISTFRDYLGNDKYTWAGVSSEPLTGATSPTTPMTTPLATANNMSYFGSHAGEFLYGKSPRSEEIESALPKKGVRWADKEKETLSNNIWEKAVQACLSLSESNDISDIVVKLLRSTINFSSVDYGLIVLKQNDEFIISAVGSSTSIHTLHEPLHGRHDLAPYSLLHYTLQSGYVFNYDEDSVMFKNRFVLDPYYTKNKCHSMCCIPLLNQANVCGAMYLECQVEKKLKYPFFDSRKINLLKLLSTQAAVSLLKVSLYDQMEIAKQAAEDATSEKASFLANMSHEIRTPFNSLLSCSIFLLDTDLTRTQKEYVETIRDSAMVTLNIIDGILSLSKMEHGSFALETSPFSVNECIESAVQFVSEQANSKNLELVFYNRCPEIEFIKGDVTRFRQILINLVGNSVKFTEKGHIIVEVVSEPLIHDRYQLSISVKDTGIGIPEEARTKVFGAFSQVDGSSRRVYGGSGLGLAISKKIAELMGGELSFESESGVGSTFYFILNAEAILRGTSEFTIEQVHQLGKVLIVDNHKYIRDELHLMLSNWKIEATVVASLEEVKDKIDDYSIVFVDSNEYVAAKMFKIKGSVFITAPFGDMTFENDNEDLIILTFPYHNGKVLEILKEMIKKGPRSIPKIEDLLLQLPEHSEGRKGLNSNNLHANKKITPLEDLQKELKLGERYPLRILLAEDNFINTKVATQHLKKFGYQADHAKDGLDALEKLYALMDKGQKYDIIFMDIQMPRMDGIAATIELQRELKARELVQFQPYVIALTANVAGEDRDRSLECGMVDFIAKPILPSELERVLTNIGKIVHGE